MLQGLVAGRSWGFTRCRPASLARVAASPRGSSSGKDHSVLHLWDAHASPSPLDSIVPDPLWSSAQDDGWGMQAVSIAQSGKRSEWSDWPEGGQIHLLSWGSSTCMDSSFFLSSTLRCRPELNIWALLIWLVFFLLPLLIFHIFLPHRFSFKICVLSLGHLGFFFFLCAFVCFCAFKIFF